MAERKPPSFATLRAKNQITLPGDIARAAHLSEGDPIEIRYFEGVITLVPKKMVDASQAWFWSPEWQQGEREASADIAAGKVHRFNTDEDFLKSLD